MLALPGTRSESGINSPMPETLTIQLSHDVHLHTELHAISI